MREWESCWKRDHVPPADVLDSLDSLRRKIRRRRPLRRLWLRISAAAAVLALVSTLVLHLLPAERPEQLFTVKAPQGTHSRISLPDGTQVWLNAGSALSYGSSFNETSREVSPLGRSLFRGGAPCGTAVPCRSARLYVHRSRHEVRHLGLCRRSRRDGCAAGRGAAFRSRRTSRRR